MVLAPGAVDFQPVAGNGAQMPLPPEQRHIVAINAEISAKQ
jgi:hypothetical protein